MNKIIVEDFEKLLSAYEEKFENLRGRTILVTGATGMIAAYSAEVQKKGKKYLRNILIRIMFIL